MDKELLREEIENVMLALTKSESLNLILSFLEGEGAVLVYLVHQPEGVMPSVISESLCLSRARITNILNSLRQKELVELENDAKDRRRILAKLTEKGFMYISEKALAKESVFDMLYEKLGEEKLKAYLELLQSFKEILEKADREGVEYE